MLVRRVVGDSMLPTLKPGQIVLGLGMLKPKQGRIVIVQRRDMEIVKRLTNINGNKLYVTGDNQLHSTDSKQFGWIDKKQLLATVIWPKN